jgi:hypothetical protein
MITAAPVSDGDCRLKNACGSNNGVEGIGIWFDANKNNYSV